jgi:hypothetical protein
MEKSLQPGLKMAKQLGLDVSPIDLREPLLTGAEAAAMLSVRRSWIADAARYTALSRRREQTRFYVVSPGSIERALPGMTWPEHRPDVPPHGLQAVSEAEAPAPTRLGRSSPTRTNHASASWLTTRPSASGRRASRYARQGPRSRAVRRRRHADTGSDDPASRRDDLGMDL